MKVCDLFDRYREPPDELRELVQMIGIPVFDGLCEPEQAFISVAVSRWHIVVTTRRDVTQLTVRGPETTATVTPIPAGAEFFGIVFRLGTFMAAMPLAGLVDRVVTLPAATPSSQEELQLCRDGYLC